MARRYRRVVRSDRWGAYVRELRGDDSDVRAGKRVGVHSGTIGRWALGQVPDPRWVTAFARAYGRSPLEALLAAELIDPEDLGWTPETADLSQRDDAELLLEMLRRQRNRVMHGVVPMNQANMAVIQAMAAAEKLMALPAFPTLLRGRGEEDEVNAEAPPVARAARRGRSRGEAARQAQDDDAHSADDHD